MDILYIILGWLLGILSPGIINYISDKRRAKRIKGMMISDLNDLKTRLMWLPFRVKSDYGVINKDDILWLKIQTNNWNSISTEDPSQRLENLKDKASIEKFVSLINSSRKKDPAFNFKKMTTAVIDSNLISAEIIDDTFLSKILEIKFQINSFNQEVDRVDKLLKMTFDSNIIGENHRIISSQIEKTNFFLADKAFYIVEKINHIINFPENN